MQYDNLHYYYHCRLGLSDEARPTRPRTIAAEDTTLEAEEKNVGLKRSLGRGRPRGRLTSWSTQSFCAIRRNDIIDK